MITFDPDELRKRTAELERKMSEPGFWDDQQQAAQISAEHSRLTRRLERYERLTREYEDARELLSMDGEMADEIAATLEPLQQELSRLQEDALFSGEYDSGDALVTIHAGTGGTDAQDWAEILLRMYLRWADQRSFGIYAVAMPFVALTTAYVYFDARARGVAEREPSELPAEFDLSAYRQDSAMAEPPDPLRTAPRRGRGRPDGRRPDRALD